MATAAACVFAAPLAAQEGILAPPRLELRGGLAWHGAGGCLRNSATGLAGGIDLRTSGRLILSASGDLFFHSSSCFRAGLVHIYQDRQVETFGSPTLGPRIAAALGYAIPLGGLSVELTAGIGTVVTKTRYGVSRFDISLRPWQGGALTLRFPNDLGVQLEIGRHQLAERYYDLTTDAPVAEVLRWERMVRLALSFPIAG